MMSLVAIPGTLLMLVALLWIADLAERRLGQNPATEIAMAAEPVTTSPATGGG